MIKVNGIGGVFLYADDPRKLAEWYTLNFGIEFYSDMPDTPYMVFHHRDDTDVSVRRSTVFAIMQAKAPLGAERREHMINYRVDDLPGFLEQLRANGVTTGAIEESHDGRYPDSVGRFSWITDPEGNQIELYQPV